MPEPHPLDNLDKWYWNRVEKGGPDECWRWLGAHDKDGYGAVWSMQKHWRVNRLAYFVEHGHEAKDLVCHTCDNSWCVNPAHLYDGTFLDNTRDRQRSGVSVARWGEDNPRSRLTAAQISEIRASTDTTKALAEQYGVARNTIWRIRTGRARTGPGQRSPNAPTQPVQLEQAVPLVALPEYVQTQTNINQEDDMKKEEWGYVIKCGDCEEEFGERELSAVIWQYGMHMSTMHDASQELTHPPILARLVKEPQ